MSETLPKTVVIVNPQSAAGATRREWPRLSRILQGRYGQFETRFTSAPGEATSLARTALQEGAEAVIAVGGDGTLNEVANGFFEASKPGSALVPLQTSAHLGLFPFGTGGDFRRTLEMPKRPIEAAHTLRFATPSPFDVGKVDFQHEGTAHSRAFLNIASFGLSGVVDNLVSGGPKWLGGTLAFYLGSLRGILQYEAQPVRVEVDGAVVHEGPLYLGAVANGMYFGGGMKLAPDASPSDGIFDVVLVKPMPKLRWLVKVNSVYEGNHTTLPEVSIHRGKTITATPLCEKPILIDIDGEQPGALPATFTVHNHAIKVLTPKKA